MELLLFLPIIISFLIVFFILPWWIKRTRKFGLVGKDMNKYKKTEVAEAGGITVIAGFVLSVLLYVAMKTFYFSSSVNLVEIFALLAVILMLSLIGLIDSLLGWRIGLGRKFRVFLCLFAAIPLVVINAGNSQMWGIELGLLYPLVIIPLGIIGTSTTFNFLAGFNGLEAGQGIIILTALSFVAYFTGTTWLALIGLCMVASLIAFFLFNRFPAKVFPGDVLTYPVGGMIAIMAILGNIEKIAIFFFIPYIFEVGLKLRGGLRKQSFGIPNKDGSLDLAYGRIYGLTHLAILSLSKIKKKVYERDVVWLIHAVQIAIILGGLLIFRNSIF